MAGYHCSNCRENIPADKLKKVAIGADRNVLFCGSCNCYVTLEEPNPLAKKVAPAQAQTPSPAPKSE